MSIMELDKKIWRRKREEIVWEREKHTIFCALIQLNIRIQKYLYAEN